MPTHLYQKVADDLRSRIKAGEFPPGSKLPSRSDLCAEHGVSGITVARAMLILKFEGLVKELVGVGMFVVGTDPDAPAGQ